MAITKVYAKSQRLDVAIKYVLNGDKTDHQLGKIEKCQHPPRMTSQMRKDLMRFERIREHSNFLRENNITAEQDMAQYVSRTEETLAGLLKRRTILNVRKKRRHKLYTALADAEALSEAQKSCEDGFPGAEALTKQYQTAVSVLDNSGVNREALKQEKAALYNELAEINREIRAVRKTLKMCAEIREKVRGIQRDLQRAEPVRQRKEQERLK